MATNSFKVKGPSREAALIEAEARLRGPVEVLSEKTGRNKVVLVCTPRDPYLVAAEQAQNIVVEATRQAERIKDDAREDVDAEIQAAREQAEAIVEKAREQADVIVKEARDQADISHKNAKELAGRIVMDADRKLAQACAQAGRIVKTASGER